MSKVFKNLVVFIMCFCVSACSCTKNDSLIIYKSYYDVDISTFNYLLSNEYQEMIRVANLIDGLVEHDKYGNIVPSIASSWSSEIINDKQVWTFNLKNNVYWSDYEGNKYALVTAHDFVTSLKYILNYSSNSENYYLASYLIENGENYYNGTLIKNHSLNLIEKKIRELESNDPNNQLPYYKNIKNIFDKCNSNNNCTTNFDDVGIKAIDDFTLQYTLSKPVPYFLSTLTHYSFLPANESFINEVGFNNFGSNKKNLLYNGCYLLKEYFHSSRLEYIKNPNYWDKDNVFIDKLIFTKALNYRTANYDRLSYESGNITEFSLSQLDTVGWEKYVIGDNGEGTKYSPVGTNTYFSNEINNFISYYLVFNQNRVNFEYTSLTKNELDIANAALKNKNFRRALIYGLSKESYVKDENVVSLFSLVPEGFISYNGKDYSKYFIDNYIRENNTEPETAIEKLNKDSFYNKEKSNYYLELAFSELNLSSNQLPVKIEYTYYFNEAQTIKDKNMIDNWNRILNGCLDSSNCNYDKIEIVYNSSITSVSDYSDAFYNQEYGITAIGLYPDFNDPTAYLKAFSTTGEMHEYINHNNFEIDDRLNEIDQYYSDADLDMRYTLASLLEYDIIFDEALALPVCLEAAKTQIVVSDLIPYQRMKASYGLSQFKFKYRKISNIKYTQEDIKKLKEEYEAGKHESN